MGACNKLLDNFSSSKMFFSRWRHGRVLPAGKLWKRPGLISLSLSAFIVSLLQASQYEQQMYEQQQREAQIYEQQQQQQMQMQMWVKSYPTKSEGCFCKCKCRCRCKKSLIQRKKWGLFLHPIPRNPKWATLNLLQWEYAKYASWALHHLTFPRFSKSATHLLSTLSCREQQRMYEEQQRMMQQQEESSMQQQQSFSSSSVQQQQQTSSSSSSMRQEVSSSSMRQEQSSSVQMQQETKMTKQVHQVLLDLPCMVILKVLDKRYCSISISLVKGDRNSLFPWHVWGGVQATLKNEEARGRGTGRGLKKCPSKVFKLFFRFKRWDRLLLHSARQRWRSCTHQHLLHQRFLPNWCNFLFPESFYLLKVFVSSRIISLILCCFSGNHCGRWWRQGSEDSSWRGERVGGLQKTGHLLSFSIICSDFSHTYCLPYCHIAQILCCFLKYFHRERYWS